MSFSYQPLLFSGLISTPAASGPAIGQTVTGADPNSILVTDGSSKLSDKVLSNGQLLIGSTGSAPVVATITGTTNQIIVTTGSGAITLSLPQSIATTSSPTFANLNLTPSGAIDTTTTGTLAIGTINANVINIGNSGATINIQGTTLYENVTQLQVKDPLITINKGGGAGSASHSGIEIEENAIITAYAATSSDRLSWQFLAPATAGIVTLTPGAGGITINQSSHDPVTIGTANGLSLSGQVLSLAAASASVTGAVNAVAQTFGGQKTLTSPITLTDSGTGLNQTWIGPGSSGYQQWDWYVGASTISLKNDALLHYTLQFDNTGATSFGGALQDVGTLEVYGLASKKTLVIQNNATTPGDLLTALASNGTTVLAKIDNAGNISGNNLSGTNTGDQTITLTGDVTGSGTGSFATTLATVNANVGSFGSASSVMTQTVNAKGLTTAAASVPIQITESQVTNLTTDLAGKVTSVAVASSNGFAGTSSGTSTPTITLTTTVTGVLKGNATAISAATSGTDYSAGTSALTTGILKSTTTTGTLSIAVAGTDYQAPGNYITALTGDATASGPGSAAVTLATVNSNVGSFTISNITVNGKGLITAASSASTTGSGSVVLATTPTITSISAGSTQISNVLDPTSSQQAATKNYVDTVVAGLQPQTAVYAASTATIAGTYVAVGAGIGDTYTTTATGTFTIDGTTPALGARILLKDQTSGYQNGIYTITTLGTTGVSTIFTRAFDYDTPADVNGAGMIPIINGTVNALSSWQQIANVTSIGPAGTALVFSEYTANPSLYLLKANNLSDVSSASTSRTNLGLGTIATQNANAVAITGGSIDGTTVGATTASTGAFTSLSSTGVLSNSLSNALSQSSVLISGAPIATGGTATTTKPLVLIETSGATSNNWNTAGTEFGVNSASAFTGDLLNFQVNSVSKLSVNAAGTMILSSGTMYGSGNGNTQLQLLPTGSQIYHNYGDATQAFSIWQGSATSTGNILNLKSGTGATIVGSFSQLGAQTNNAAGALSAPAFSMTGAPITGGSGTTTVPLMYLNSGTAPTTFSTAGTVIGVNAPSGFTGNLIDVRTNGGASAFSVSSTGVGSFNNTISAANFLTVSTNLNLVNSSNSGIVASALSFNQFGSSTNVNFRLATNQSATATLPIGNSYASLLIAQGPITTAASGTHGWLTNEMVGTLGTVTAGGATVTNTASLYVDAASAAGTNNYSLYVNGPSAQSGSHTITAAGALSAPAFSMTGVPVTGGSGTTTFPLMYLNSGAAPTTFSTSGTMIGVNAPSGFSGNLLDLRINGAAALITANNAGTITASNFLTSSASSNFYNPSNNGIASSAAAINQFGGSTNNSFRLAGGQAATAALPIGNNYSAMLLAQSPITTAASGTHAWLVNEVVNTLGTVTAGGATVTNTASLYVGGPSSAGTNNYSLYVNGSATATALALLTTSTATASGTTTLTSTSNGIQVFTGTLTQTVQLPVATTLNTGWVYTFINQSTNAVLVQTSGSNTLQNMATNTQLVATLINNAGGTGTASWTWVYTSINAAAPLISPLTNKGDILTYTTVPARQGVPFDYGYLIADNAQTTGWRPTRSTETNGKPGKNYIQYADFENAATTGWALGTVGTLTNGLPTGTPTFGSGASGNLSIAATTSSKLSGTNSLSMVSSAASTVGDMLASIAFTIDASSQAKVLNFNFNYSVNSGAANGNFSGTSSNTYAVAVWDATNSAFIPVVGAFNLIQSTGVGIASGTFQTNSNTQSINFIVYCANASAGAITMYFDDIYVGPQNVSYGAAMSDPVSFIPTFTGLGTVSILSAYSWREGAYLKGQVFLTTGTPTGVAAQMTLGFNGATGNVTTASTYVTSGSTLQTVGKWNSNGGSTTFFSGGTLLAPQSTNYLEFGVENSTGNGVSITNGSAAFGTGQNVGITFEVRIQGWSSNTVQSSDTDNRVVAARYTSTASTTYTSTYADVVNATLDFDTHGAYNGTTFTVPVTGKYRASSAIAFVAGTSQGTIRIAITKNGTVASVVNYEKGGTVNAVSGGTISGLVNCVAGDTLKIQLYQDMVGTLALNADATMNWVSFERLSGTAIVQATESVNGRYHGCTATVTSSLSNVTYSTKDFDSHNAYSGATLTIPVSGKYQINAGISVVGTFALNVNTFLDIIKNGSQYTEAAYQDGGATAAAGLIVSDIVSCLAGDTISIQVATGATGPTINASNFRNYISWTRVGN